MASFKTSKADFDRLFINSRDTFLFIRDQSVSGLWRDDVGYSYNLFTRKLHDDIQQFSSFFDEGERRCQIVNKVDVRQHENEIVSLKRRLDSING